MDVDIKQIRQLADLAIEKDLAEIVVTDGDKSVTIKTLSSVQLEHNPVVYAAPSNGVAAVSAPAPAVAPSSPGPAAPAAEPVPSVASVNGFTVTAPMVGTFYSSPSPESPPFVSVGQVISQGQTVCIIEAMKLMNELEAEVSGKVLQVLVENGQPVEFGQPLMVIEQTN